MAKLDLQLPDGDRRSLNFIVVSTTKKSALGITNYLAEHPEVNWCDDIHELQISPPEPYLEDTPDATDDPGKYLSFLGYADPFRYSYEQLLSSRIFDNVAGDQRAAGLHLTYGEIEQQGLWEYIENKSKAGDFCVVHLRRNAIADYFELPANQQYHDATVVKRLPKFCDAVSGLACKVDKFSRDRMVLTYPELLLDPSSVLHAVCYFLEISHIPSGFSSFSWSRSLEMAESSLVDHNNPSVANAIRECAVL